jgi:hypothetical protein
VYFGYPQAHEDDAEQAVRGSNGALDLAGVANIARVSLLSVPLK